MCCRRVAKRYPPRKRSHHLIKPGTQMFLQPQLFHQIRFPLLISPLLVSQPDIAGNTGYERQRSGSMLWWSRLMLRICWCFPPPNGIHKFRFGYMEWKREKWPTRIMYTSVSPVLMRMEVACGSASIMCTTILVCAQPHHCCRDRILFLIVWHDRNSNSSSLFEESARNVSQVFLPWGIFALPAMRWRVPPSTPSALLLRVLPLIHLGKYLSHMTARRSQALSSTRRQGQKTVAT